MSFLIEGVELPDVTCGAELTIYRGVDGQAIPEKYEIPTRCLIRLLPHEDLIDKGMVCDFIKALWFFPKKPCLEFVLEQFQALPTFIRAERSGE